MLSKEAVEEFMSRPRRDFRWLKQLSYDDMLLEVHYRDPGLEFAQRPWLHQLVCIWLGLHFRYWLFFVDAGGGKTFLSLMLLDHYRREEGDAQSLVLLPRKVLAGDWEDAVAEYTSFTIEPVDVSALNEKRDALLDAAADIVAIDYAGLELACTQYVKHKRARERDDKFVKHLQRKYPRIVGDEFHRCGKFGTNRYGILRKLRATADVFYGLTATPTNLDPTKLWQQFSLVDQGETLGETLGLFRQAFFDEKKNWFGGKDYKFDTSKARILHTFLQNRSIRYTEAEFAEDLPDRRIIPIRVSMTDAQREATRAVIKGNEVDGVRVPLAGAYYRMRQITSGYLDWEDDEGRHYTTFPENPKLEALAAKIEELPPDAKFVIFHIYVKTGHIIDDWLTQQKIEHGWIYGGTKNSDKVKRHFVESKSCRALLLNTQVGSEGLNLQVAAHGFLFEIPSNPTEWRQCIKRIHRSGSLSTVRLYPIIARRSSDEHIMEALEEGLDLEAKVVNGNFPLRKLGFMDD
jgi:SNF2 family DNA or RNA helicase